jgi:HSP20 family protein
MTLGTLVRRPAARRPIGPSFDRLVADLYQDLGAPRSQHARAGFEPRALTPNAFARSFSPHVSAEELENEYRIVAEVPGVETQDLDVNVDDGILVIRGERRYAQSEAPNVSAGPLPEVAPPAASAEDSTHAEAAEMPAAVAAAPSATFERKLRFPGDINEAGVSASLKNGVLTVTVPKAEVVKPTVLNIPVEAA